MNNHNGIIYLNAGTKMLPRLLVSIHSLQKHYNGPISIISIGDESTNKCIDIVNNLKNINLVHIEQNLKCKHYYWFEKSRVHLYTPYTNSVFIDSDTLILDNIDELFNYIEEYDFIVPQFSDWLSCGRRISKRLKSWNKIDCDLVEKTIQSKMPSVNVGVYGFKKNSELMKYWFDFTMQNPESPLPEETSCHLLLQKYKSKIISNKYNCSCKYDDAKADGIKIIHYHGRKHCRFKNKKPIFHSDLWIKEWKEIYQKNLCDINNWYNTIGDSFLRKNIELINNYVE